MMNIEAAYGDFKLVSFLPRNSYVVVENISLSSGVEEFGFTSKHHAFGYTVFHNFDDFSVLSVPGSESLLIVLGHVYNPFNSLVGREALTYVADALADDTLDFYDAVGCLGGRFVLVVFRNNDNIEVVPDACSSLPVAYTLHRSKLILSSHPSIIKKLFSIPCDSVVQELCETKFYKIGIRHCPADLTEVQGVKLLTPNLVILFCGGEIQTLRIFPKSERIERNVNEVVEEVCFILLNSVDCLVGFKKPIFCALSGGVDSRLTLASAVNKKYFFQFFTFSGEGNANRDLLCTQELSHRLSIKFNSIKLGANVPCDAFLSVYRDLQGITRAPNARETFYRQQYFGVGDAFEVRSSISEITRSFMKRKFQINSLPLLPGFMVPMYKRVVFNRAWHSLISEAFSDWMSRSSFVDVKKYGYEWLDFYYWEIRVGTWQSLVLQDADYYTTPTVLFNNRKLLELMLSVPESYRKDDALQMMIMERLDADVLQVPIVKNFGKKAKVRELIESTYLKLYRAWITM